MMMENMAVRNLSGNRLMKLLDFSTAVCCGVKIVMLGTSCT